MTGVVHSEESLIKIGNDLLLRGLLPFDVHVYSTTTFFRSQTLRHLFPSIHSSWRLRTKTFESFESSRVTRFFPMYESSVRKDPFFDVNSEYTPRRPDYRPCQQTFRQFQFPESKLRRKSKRRS